MHREWFEVAEAHAAKVVRKWREWILQEPYFKEAGSKQWLIKPDILDTLELVCEPVPQDVSTQRRSSQKNQRARKVLYVDRCTTFHFSFGFKGSLVVSINSYLPTYQDFGYNHLETKLQLATTVSKSMKMTN